MLFRAAYQSRALEDELVKRGLSYKMIRGKAFGIDKKLLPLWII